MPATSCARRYRWRARPWRPSAAAGGDAEVPLRAADDVLAGVGHLLLAWALTAILQAAPDDAARRAMVRAGLLHSASEAEMHWRRAQRALAPTPAMP